MSKESYDETKSAPNEVMSKALELHKLSCPSSKCLKKTDFNFCGLYFVLHASKEF